MSNWTAITIGDLTEAKAATVIETLRTQALGLGQADPLPEIIADVTARIRAEVASCSSNVLDADRTKIPESLKSLAKRLVIWEAQSRINISDAFKPSEQDNEDHRNDERRLVRIAACELKVEPADNPLAAPAVQAGSVGPSIRPRPRQFSRETQSGL